MDFSNYIAPPKPAPGKSKRSLDRKLAQIERAVDRDIFLASHEYKIARDWQQFQWHKNNRNAKRRKGLNDPQIEFAGKNRKFELEEAALRKLELQEGRWRSFGRMAWECW